MGKQDDLQSEFGSEIGSSIAFTDFDQTNLVQQFLQQQQQQNEMIKLKMEALENKCAMLEEKMENMKLKGIMREENDKKQIDQMKAESQQKFEDANKRAEEIENAQDNVISAQNTQIAQLKQVLAANQQKIARMENVMNEHYRQMERMKADLQMLKDAKLEAAFEVKKKVEEVKISNQWHLCNPAMNKWDKRQTIMHFTFSEDGLSITSYVKYNAFAVRPFHFADDGTTQHGIRMNYYEVKIEYYFAYIGLSTDRKYHAHSIGEYAHSYAIKAGYIEKYKFSGAEKQFEWSKGAERPEIHSKGRNVYGCGLLAWPNQKRSIFFTANGKLLGQTIPIAIKVPLFPAVTPTELADTTRCHRVEANFGDNPDIPFWYDLKKCAGMNLEAE